jgi:hypothetical protein
MVYSFGHKSISVLFRRFLQRNQDILEVGRWVEGLMETVLACKISWIWLAPSRGQVLRIHGLFGQSLLIAGL